MSSEERRSVKQPVLSRLGEGHWAAARAGHLALQCCADCSRYTHYPSAVCEHCLSTNVTIANVSGLGTIESFSVVHRAFSPDFAADVPYTVALVKLDEGVNLLTWLVGLNHEDARIGMRVQATFEQVSEQAWLHRFRPVESGR